MISIERIFLICAMPMSLMYTEKDEIKAPAVHQRSYTLIKVQMHENSYLNIFMKLLTNCTLSIIWCAEVKILPACSSLLNHDFILLFSKFCSPQFIYTRPSGAKAPCFVLYSEMPDYHDRS